MNTLDVIFAVLIITFTLISKYNDFYNQVIRFIAIIISIAISKIILQNLIIFFYPLIGYSKVTKPLLYYSSLTLFYIILNIALHIIVYRFQSAKENKFINLCGGLIISFANSILIISIIMSIVFLSIHINDRTIEKLQKSVVFYYIYNIKINFIDHEE